MAYRIEFSPSAEREYKRLPEHVRDRIRPKLRALTEDPRPAGTTKLVAARDLYRIRIGDYRVICDIRDQVLVVLIVSVAHQREIYCGI